MASNSANPSHRRILEPKGTGRLREVIGNSAASSSSASRPGTGVQSREQTFEEQQRQHRAATILESNEMLVWASMEMCESLAQTKLHFQRELASLPAEDETIEWPESFDYSSEDEATLHQGAIFTSEGWYDPKKHKSVAERVLAQKARETERGMQLNVLRENVTESVGSSSSAGASAGYRGGPSNAEGNRTTSEERRKRKSPGGRTPNKGASGIGAAKRAAASGSGSGV